MLADVNANAIVYQVLDEVLAQGCVPAGARGAMFALVDELRSTTTASEALRAERISIELHKLEWALRQRDGRAVDAVRDQLKALATEWIDSRICSRH